MSGGDGAGGRKAMAGGRGRGTAVAALGLLALGAVVVWFGVLRPERPAGVPELSADAPPGQPSAASPNRGEAASVPGRTDATPGAKPSPESGKGAAGTLDRRPPAPGEGASSGPRPPDRPNAPVADGAVPSFDIVRVERSGESVIAGRGAAGATVELMRNGTVHARVVSDPSGLFAFVPPPLPPGSHEIVLNSIAPDGARAQSRESVTIVVDPERDAKPLVAMAAPDQPTVVLSGPEAPGDKPAEGATPETRRPPEGASVTAALDPPPARPPGENPLAPPSPANEAARPDGPGGAGGAQPPPAAASRPAVKIVSVEAEEGGRLFVSAQASPGATVRLYLNETLVAPGGAGGDGRVSFAIGRGVRPGGYRVRIDDVDPVSGVVKSRAEVEFKVPAPLTVATPSAAAPSTPPAAVGPSAGTSAAFSSGARPAAPVQRGESAGSAAAPFLAPPVLAPPAAPAPLASFGPRPEMPQSSSVARPTEPAARGAAPGPPPAPALRDAAPESGPALAAAPPPKGSIPTIIAPASPPRPLRDSDPGMVVIPEVNTAIVGRGDNLWNISRRIYGSGVRYTVIYSANPGQIRNPNLIYPGQLFVLPGGEGGVSAR